MVHRQNENDIQIDGDILGERCGLGSERRDWTTFVFAFENESACIGTSTLRCCEHARSGGGSISYRFRSQSHWVYEGSRARCSVDRCRIRPDSSRWASIVVSIRIPIAGIPRKPGMTRDDLFNINAGIVKTLCEGIADHCPNAWVAIISNPVNSTIPIAAEVFKKKGCYDPKRLFGVTTLDVVRSRTFIGEILGIHPKEVQVNVIGGHAGITILPLLSQANPELKIDEARLAELTERIQNAGTEVVKAKDGAGSATLSMAYAAAEFTDACLKALNGDDGIVQCAYVASNVTDLPYFASPLKIGKTGIEEFLPLGALSDTEKAAMEKLKSELTSSIEKGIKFVANS